MASLLQVCRPTATHSSAAFLSAAASGGPLPLAGQAVAFLRRRAILLTELSAVAGNPLLYRTATNVANGPRTDTTSVASFTHLQHQTQQQPVGTDSLQNAQVSREVRPPLSAGTQQQDQEQEKVTQERLVRAVQHLLEVGAESLQLLDVDGEVRHFSVLHEQLNFKCLRRLSLGWTITPELLQLLFLFSSRKLRSLQKLNFNGPAQIHPEAYIHINHSKSVSISSSCCLWCEPLVAPLEEATLRRSAGLNNYGLGQIHLQLYALLNCGACSVSEIEYARQQQLQQQLLMLGNNKRNRAIANEIKRQRDPLCLDMIAAETLTVQAEGVEGEQAFEGLQKNSGEENHGNTATSSRATEEESAEHLRQSLAACSDVTLDLSRMLLHEEGQCSNKPSKTAASSCRQRVQQAGSWLWRAIPSTLRGLAGSRGSPSDAAQPPTEFSLETADRPRTGYMTDAQGFAQAEQLESNAPSLQSCQTDARQSDREAIELEQGDAEGIPSRRRRPSPSDAEDREVPKAERTPAAVPGVKPRPKRRRLVETPGAGLKGATKLSTETLRRHVAEFAREHLPLLGDLVCPRLEVLFPATGALMQTQNGTTENSESLPKEFRETEYRLKRAELQVLRGVTSFLLDMAVDSLGPTLAELDSNTPTAPSGSYSNKAPETLSTAQSPLLAFSVNESSRHTITEAPAAAQRDEQVQSSQCGMQKRHEDDDGLSLLKLLQYSPSPRTSWSHGVFFKYAYVDLDFECLATFRICLCHHPLFIFYKEHEKGLHVLHVDAYERPMNDSDLLASFARCNSPLANCAAVIDAAAAAITGFECVSYVGASAGVFNAAADSAQEKTELWRERLSYTYVCDPAVPFERQQQHHQRQQQQQRSRRHEQNLETLEAPEPAGIRLNISFLGPRRGGNQAEVRDGPATGRGGSSEGPIHLQLPAGSTAGGRELTVAAPSMPRDGDIRLCSAKASLCRGVAQQPREEETASALLPHVGPQMTGFDLFCLEMWSVLSLCRDQVCPPTLPQYLGALRRLWLEALTQQQRDIYNNIITPKYIARRLKAPDLTFEALPPWWQQQQQPQSRRRPKGTGVASPSVERNLPASSHEHI